MALQAVKDFSAYQGVWVFAEQRDKELMPVVYELLGEGRKLADEIGTELCAVLVGHQVETLAERLISHGADKVYLMEDEKLENFNTDGYTEVIAKAMKEYKPEIMLIGATHIGRDLAPRLAARVDTGLTADCTRLQIDPKDKKLLQTRPAFGGNLMATIICPNHRPQMSTVRPGVMDKAAHDAAHKGQVIRLESELTEASIRTKILEIVKSKDDKVSLTEANIIVAGGMGLGGPQGFELLQELANQLGGVIASSRACVDAGFIDHSYQVGQTGTTVKPNLYIACGISGAIQHVAGMSESDTIIAINNNESAPIFEVADYGIVGDVYEVIPEMIEYLKKEAKLEKEKISG